MIEQATASYPVWNGPNQGTWVDAPVDATVGTACALKWRTIRKADRFAVYILTEYQGQKGLMFVKNYDTKDRAVQKVRTLTAIVAGLVS